MNPIWFGDSYDIVKRFFALSLHELDYEVFIDPMLTGEWDGKEDGLYDFLKMRPVNEYRGVVSAVFLDPDTGIGKISTPKHTTMSSIVELMKIYEVVFSFDQSFSRSSDPQVQMKAKLKTLADLGGYGFYFDSHARFLFASSDASRIDTLRDHLVGIGLPEDRLFRGGSTNI